VDEILYKNTTEVSRSKRQIANVGDSSIGEKCTF